MKIFRYVASTLLCYAQLSMGMSALQNKQNQMATGHMQSSLEDVKSNLTGLAGYKSYQFGDATVTVAKGDITNTRVDAIVNAANPSLRWLGGVCSAIFNVAGKNNLTSEVRKVIAKMPEDERNNELLRVGKAYVTPIPKTDEIGMATINNDMLRVKYVVHAVGPDCRNREQNENRKTLLGDAYRNSLLEADKVGIKSIALPAISTAIFAYPIQEATPVALDSIVDTAKRTSIKHILCMFLPNDKSGGYDRYTEYLDKKSAEQK